MYSLNQFLATFTILFLFSGFTQAATEADADTYIKQLKANQLKTDCRTAKFDNPDLRAGFWNTKVPDAKGASRKRRELIVDAVAAGIKGNNNGKRIFWYAYYEGNERKVSYSFDEKKVIAACKRHQVKRNENEYFSAYYEARKRHASLDKIKKTNYQYGQARTNNIKAHFKKYPSTIYPGRIEIKEDNKLGKYAGYKISAITEQGANEGGGFYNTSIEAKVKIGPWTNRVFNSVVEVTTGSDNRAPSYYAQVWKSNRINLGYEKKSSRSLKPSDFDLTFSVPFLGSSIQLQLGPVPVLVRFKAKGTTGPRVKTTHSVNTDNSHYYQDAAFAQGYLATYDVSIHGGLDLSLSAEIVAGSKHIAFGGVGLEALVHILNGEVRSKDEFSFLEIPEIAGISNKKKVYALRASPLLKSTLSIGSGSVQAYAWAGLKVLGVRLGVKETYTFVSWKGVSWSKKIWDYPKDINKDISYFLAPK